MIRIEPPKMADLLARTVPDFLPIIIPAKQIAKVSRAITIAQTRA